MKSICLKIFSTIFIIFLLSITINAKASNQSGHDEFDIITMDYDSDAKLLVWMNTKEKNKMIDKVKWKFFGLSTYNQNYREPVYYQARTIFSRSNLTSSSIKFTYNMNTGKTVTNSFGVSGSIDAKLSAKIKSLTINGDVNFKTEWEESTKITEEEKINFSVSIHPNCKVSLLVKGTAELTNGGAKNYFLGIPVKKGNFEFVDVVTEYYELLEEYL